jgi:hypothetical protein
VGREDPGERVPHRLHLGLVQGELLERGRVAGRRQEPVALAQGHLQAGRQVQDHVGAGTGAARLDKAQVAGGDPREQRQVELAEAPAAAPVAQQRSDPGGAVEVPIAASLAAAARPATYLPGNRSAPRAGAGVARPLPAR